MATSEEELAIGRQEAVWANQNLEWEVYELKKVLKYWMSD